MYQVLYSNCSGIYLSLVFYAVSSLIWQRRRYRPKKIYYMILFFYITQNANLCVIRSIIVLPTRVEYSSMYTVPKLPVIFTGLYTCSLSL